MKSSDKSKSVRRSTPCDSCAYFDVIDEEGNNGCVLDLDEDELYRQRTGENNTCPYYKFYNEYKSVQKQN